ncbi:hypothetical protein AZI86_10845 [Bdellovibrio bacteriovorus]|uniref:Uncharacterized protein n=1 Tax=Bdellovibrio bacteriovorus TaxID=959 RepID=A0A150WL42_BDEBC|nr:hypothetical protein [Bdellovibrio bacteriovorus]KYG64700.1 hypothetical protein AZI86_10845 [Bdellovibrio bacteriovorus]
MIKKIALSVVVVVGIGLGVYFLSASPEEKTKGPESSKETPANSPPQLPQPGPKAIVKAEAVVPSERATSSPVQKSAENKAFTDFKYRADLERYLGIRKKVLMAKNEERDKKELLEDRTLIQSMKPLLLAEASKDTASLQNAALDYLFEALQAGARDEVAAVLRDVVADTTIENNSNSLDSRKALAGVKAEVLLNWSSLDPKADAQIEASLPGPVSQKIWSHVKAHQDNNVAESQTLQAKKSN